MILRPPTKLRPHLSLTLGLLLLFCLAPGTIADRTAYASSIVDRSATGYASGTFDLLSDIDDAQAERLRLIFKSGRERGRQSAVFAKVGDSITASGSFLSDIGLRREVLGGHTELRPIISFYRAAVVDWEGGRAHNSFNRTSLAARAGWTGADILGLVGDTAPERSPLLQEYEAINPAVSIIMFGTNDMDRTGPERFLETVELVVDQTLAAGIIPILSTVPDRLDSPQAAERTPLFNTIIRAVAENRQLPLIDYWAALQPLPNHGLQRDLVHPSIYPRWAGSVWFTERALAYGWNVRNLLTLQMLQRVKERVIDPG